MRHGPVRAARILPAPYISEYLQTGIWIFHLPLSLFYNIPCFGEVFHADAVLRSRPERRGLPASLLDPAECVEIRAFYEKTEPFSIAGGSVWALPGLLYGILLVCGLFW